VVSPPVPQEPVAVVVDQCSVLAVGELPLQETTGGLERVVTGDDEATRPLAVPLAAVPVHVLAAEVRQHVLQATVFAMVVEAVEGGKGSRILVGEQDSGGGFAGRVATGPRAFDLELPVADLGHGEALRLQQGQDVEGPQVAVVLLPPVVPGVGVLRRKHPCDGEGLGPCCR